MLIQFFNLRIFIQILYYTILHRSRPSYASVVNNLLLYPLGGAKRSQEWRGRMFIGPARVYGPCLSVLVEWIVLCLCILNLFNNLLNSIQFWVSVELTVHYSRFHLQQILTVHKQNLKLKFWGCHLPTVLHVLWFVHTDSQFDLQVIWATFSNSHFMELTLFGTVGCWMQYNLESHYEHLKYFIYYKT